MTGDSDNTNNSVTENGNSDSQADSKVETDTKKIADKAEKTKKPKKSSGGFIWLLLLLILIGAVGAGGYFGWQFWQEQQQRLAALEAEAARQKTSINQLGETQSNTSDDQQTLLQQLQQQQQLAQERLDSQTQRLRTLAGTSRDDWLLAEARYMLRLANQRLLIETSSDSALQLLEAADKILVDINDPAILPVRNAIAVDITALKLAPKVDREGLYVKLSALKQQIQQLPLVPLTPSLDTNNQPTSAIVNNDINETSTWYQKAWHSISNAFGSLSRFVQIRHHDQAPELLITEQQQLQVINRLLLIFEQAQYALLREEETIYHASLEQAVNNWSIYYSHYPQFETINSELKNLRDAVIVNQLPDISGSARALTDYIERFHQLNTASPKPEEVAQ